MPHWVLRQEHPSSSSAPQLLQWTVPAAPSGGEATLWLGTGGRQGAAGARPRPSSCTACGVLS
eukprot:2209965-Alexandrium_andersonii.AAC.1